ncbi:hypothetical protein AgCh_035219 [Apium graveolens]
MALKALTFEHQLKELFLKNISERTASPGIQKTLNVLFMGSQDKTSQMVIDHIKEEQVEYSETYSALRPPFHYGVKMIESLIAQFNNSMIQVVKGEINGIDDPYPSSGMEVYNITHYFSEAGQQGQHVMFSRCQSARFQVDPRESNLIIINKIIRYLKGLPTLGVKYPKDIMLNMFGYIDTDYAGCKKDWRSISKAVNLSDRRSISGTTGFWSYERSDTLVRMSVNTSGEKSETLVRYKELGRLVNRMINGEVILAAFKGTWLIRL